MNPRRQAKFFDGVPSEHGNHTVRARLDLDEGEDAVHLHRAHDPREAVARRQWLARRLALSPPAEALHLGHQNPSAVGGVTSRRDAPGSVPTAQSVNAHPNGRGRLAE